MNSLKILEKISISIAFFLCAILIGISLRLKLQFSEIPYLESIYYFIGPNLRSFITSYVTIGVIFFIILRTKKTKEEKEIVYVFYYTFLLLIMGSFLISLFSTFTEINNSKIKQYVDCKYNNSYHTNRTVDFDFFFGMTKSQRMFYIFPVDMDCDNLEVFLPWSKIKTTGINGNNRNDPLNKKRTTEYITKFLQKEIVHWDGFFCKFGEGTLDEYLRKGFPEYEKYPKLTNCVEQYLKWNRTDQKMTITVLETTRNGKITVLILKTEFKHHSDELLKRYGIFE